MWKSASHFHRYFCLFFKKWTDKSFLVICKYTFQDVRILKKTVMITIDDFISIYLISPYWKTVEQFDIHYILLKEDEFFFWVLAK